MPMGGLKSNSSVGLLQHSMTISFTSCLLCPNILSSLCSNSLNVRSSVNARYRISQLYKEFLFLDSRGEAQKIVNGTLAFHDFSPFSISRECSWESVVKRRRTNRSHCPWPSKQEQKRRSQLYPGEIWFHLQRGYIVQYLECRFSWLSSELSMRTPSFTARQFPNPSPCFIHDLDAV